MLGRVIPPPSIAVLRADLGLSNADIAAIVGRDIRTIQRWCAGAEATNVSALRLLIVYKNSLEARKMLRALAGLE